MIESFEGRLKRACEMRNLGIPQVCDLAGLKYKTLMAQISRKSKVPYETVDDICRALDLPHTYFSKHSPSLAVSSHRDIAGVEAAAAHLVNEAMQAAHLQALRRKSQLSTDDVLEWYRRTGGDLDCYDAIKDSVDLFHEMGAEDRIPDPYRIGRNSLSTRQFEIEDEDHYKARLNGFDPDLLEEIKRGRIEASRRNFIIEDVQISTKIGDREISIQYCRFIGRVVLPTGGALTMVHAMLLPQYPLVKS